MAPGFPSAELPINRVCDGREHAHDGNAAVDTPCAALIHGALHAVPLSAQMPTRRSPRSRRIARVLHVRLPIRDSAIDDPIKASSASRGEFSPPAGHTEREARSPSAHFQGTGQNDEPAVPAAQCASGSNMERKERNLIANDTARRGTVRRVRPTGMLSAIKSTRSSSSRRAHRGVLASQMIAISIGAAAIV